MSTRSGKRIHSSLHENAEQAEPEVTAKSERKTRSKRLKENDEQLNVTVSKTKKKKNYVSFPTWDEQTDQAVSKDITEKPKNKRHTLKEQNVIPESECLDANANKAVRVTRHAKKLADEETQNLAPDLPAPEKVKCKKNKKKKSRSSDVNENNDNQEDKKSSKKSKKKKKGKRQSGSSEFIVENVLNRSNTSTDSFHSAAGSPVKVTNDDLHKTPVHKVASDAKEISTFDKNDETTPFEINEGTIRKRRKSIVRNNTFDKGNQQSENSLKPEIVEGRKEMNTSGKKTRRSIIHAIENTSEASDKTNDKETMLKNTLEISRRKSSIKNTTFDKDVAREPSDKMKIDLFNNTFDKDSRSSIKNATFDKDSSVSKDTNSTYDKVDEGIDKIYSNCDKPTKTIQSLRLSTSFKDTVPSSSLNSTFEKSNKNEKPVTLDSTFNKSDAKMNSTFDKPKISSDRSSLISSDGTINLTYDKDNSRISITSDDSKAENIINTTPVLIESSMDESGLSASKQSVDLESSRGNGNVSQIVQDSLEPPVTPLKREGTFTKESPEVIDISKEKTPTRNKSLPSPGCTPYHTSRSSQKVVLNVTRSLEKSARRSSLADLAPRQTRVMFCSPTNNPAVVQQQKRKVIKSSLKGSNKSFVFDDIVSASSAVRRACRKRSYTASEAEAPRGKRTRLTDDLQHSVDRLSRPRTSSTAAKLESTPAKKLITPLKPKPESKRTKLPNFAALHRKQFDRMESLTDCQERKAKRAKQLLTPNGAVDMLQRISPKGIEATATKSKETTQTVTKKTDTPTKTPKLSTFPTLESLRPGYTRFGFKMDTEFNPFSIPSKNDNKNKAKVSKPNGLTKSLPPKTPVQPTSETQQMTRQPTLPSLKGGTTRKEAAKQTIMREKSFTSLSGKRDVTRKESRTIIKGVRTNRRFELQMKMRNID